MNEASLRVPQADILIGVQRAIAACHGPAWAIDPHGCSIVSANPAGWERLGLSEGCTTLVLDNRMPVLAQLRRLLPRLETETSVIAALEFWTGQGGEHLVCEVRQLEGSAGTRLLLVEFAFPNETIPSPAAANDDGVGGFANSDAPPVRDDRETLKEIARRIREGQRQLASRSMREDPAPRRDVASMSAAGLDPSTSARAAHELKTPISAIAAAAEIMRDEQLGTMGNERYKDYAARIVENAHHALAVIDRMLSTGDKSVAGGEVVRETPVGALDAGAFCRSVAASVTQLTEQNKLDLAVDAGPGLPHIAADETSLRQIVLNLLTNALKFTPAEGRVTLSVRTSPNGVLVIEVRDTGKGMTRAAIKRALDRPSNAAPDARAGGGYGIGLPMARALATGIGATLGIESTLGKGTVVTVRFPPNRLQRSEGLHLREGRARP